MSEDDLFRLRKEYAERAQRLTGTDLYSYFNLAYLFMTQQRQRASLNLLKTKCFSQLGTKRILEVGCGRGGILQEYLAHGATLSHLYGVDLLPDRVQDAGQILPALQLACANGQRLPYPRQSFDLVMQYTVFSSILSDPIKQDLATEMIRVLRPGGLILWYDFWLNPTNPQTRGIRPAEIRRLFAGCQVELHKITLAPPIARRLVPISWLLCAALEKLGLFNTHYFAAIQP